MSDVKRRLRAVFTNSVVWGVAWGVLGTAVTTVMRLVHGIPLLDAIGDGIGMGIRIGVMGGIAGALFATFVSVAYRNKRMSQISATRFGIGGALVAGAFVPAFMQTMNLLSGDGLVPWSMMGFDVAIAALFGGITAAGTIKLAQLAQSDSAAAGQGTLSGADFDALPAGDTVEFGSAPRSRDQTYERS